MIIRQLILGVVLATALWPFAAGAQTRQTTLSVQNMTCSLCPGIVSGALHKVSGVSDVTVSLDSAEAVVTYDDQQTSPAALAASVSDVGYPAQVKSE